MKKKKILQKFRKLIETERRKAIYLRAGKKISEREEIDAILHHT